jgi:hypothetical protein
MNHLRETIGVSDRWQKVSAIADPESATADTREVLEIVQVSN